MIQYILQFHAVTCQEKASNYSTLISLALHQLVTVMLQNGC